ncbi:Osmotin, thaumatin-like protein [Cubamyces menziesii]|nr:Osmotin, thaumatin-like protein [Cubamyces menziesii]
MKHSVALGFTALSYAVTVASARTFAIVNSCTYTIWPAFFNTPEAGSAIPSQPTGWQQNPGETVNFSVPDGWSGQIWGRRDCDFSTSSGPDSCLGGGCDGGLECTGTGAAPVSVAEFALAANNLDIYDVSLVNGFNIPVKITNNKGCATASCPVDLTPNCPAELAGPFDPSGDAVGCKSACAAGLGDPADSPNCCTGTHNTPATCPPSGVEYYSYFKGNCPNAYAYVYDTSSVSLPCTSDLQADYTITFCP